MSALGDMIRRMGEAGATAEVIAIAAEAMEVLSPPVVSKGAERTRRWRAAQSEAAAASPIVTERHETSLNVTADASLSLSPETKVPPTPPSKTQTLNPNPHPPIVPPPLEKPFDRFWKAYPVKAAKRTAEAAFDRAVKRSDPDTIIAGVAAAAKSRKWLEGFIPHPATWLNGDCWLDEIGGQAHSGVPAVLVAGWGADEWRSALEMFGETRRWSETLGPRPDEIGCRAPADVLASLGYSPGGETVVPFERRAVA